MKLSGAWIGLRQYQDVSGTASALEFEVKPLDDGQLIEAQVVPLVDGRRLVDLVAADDAAHGYEPTGGYGGLVPSFFRLGDLARYYLGQQEPWIDMAVAVLACDCEELGCWPLQTLITIDDQQISWHDFGQPHPPRAGLRPLRTVHLRPANVRSRGTKDGQKAGGG